MTSKNNLWVWQDSCVDLKPNTAHDYEVEAKGQKGISILGLSLDPAGMLSRQGQV